MKCPACAKNLMEIKSQNLTVDACQGGCGGIFFPSHQLQKVEYADESEGKALLQIEKDPNVEVDLDKKRSCPQCNVVMMQHFYSPKRSVVVDECPKCGGFWLDAGELGSIRSVYKNATDRDQAVGQYFNDIFKPALNKDLHDYE